MSLVAIQTPQQVDAQRRAEQEKRIENEAAKNQPKIVDSLASHVRSMWEIAKQDKLNVQSRLMDCLRRRKGEYSPEKLQQIKSAKGSEIYMQITGGKCRSAKAWLTDIFAPAGEKPWTLTPTPFPEIKPSIKQQLVQTAIHQAMLLGVPVDQAAQIVARHRNRLEDEMRVEAEKSAERMSQRIEDELIEGGFRKALDEYLDDVVTFPAAIFRGPVYRRRKGMHWTMGPNDEWVPVAGDKLVRECYRVSPFDAFPSPASVEIDDDWFIERHRLTRSDLASMRGVPGYSEQGILQALSHYSTGGLKEWLWSDGERERLEGRYSFSNRAGDDTIDALEWSGFLQGKTLLDWGMDPQVIKDPYEEYNVSVMVIGNYVVRAVVNPDPTGQSDYFKSCWQPLPGSFWGTGLPEILADCQDVCNAACRSLVNNMGVSSGPQVWYDADRVPPGADVSHIFPWKIWATSTAKSGTSQPGIGFFQPSSNANELMGIYERFSRYADEITGMPAYAFGSDSGAGAARTASGLSMLMGNTSKAVKAVVRNIDLNLIEPLITKFYTHLMLMDDDQNIKGDLVVKARGSDGLLQKEAAQRRQIEFLGMTNNPTDMAIIGMDGRRELLHEAAKTLDIPVNRVVPDKERMEANMMEQQMQMAMQGGMPAPGGNPYTGQQQGQTPPSREPNPSMIEPQT
ncbi:portal protein [Ferrimonas balearica]|uniref:portal protein n=1 Tax=Ferrimonas balearica TaxID=44012 RepID=UPI001F4924FD|nr:hypothetical protein [Ferrimonas balearica]MBY6093852.1 hypothetical protein [Ferrimonas balearica]